MTFDEAKEHLEGAINPDGGLYSLGWYLNWLPGRSTACLDGDFEAKDLEAIAIYMRDYKENQCKS